MGSAFSYGSDAPRFVGALYACHLVAGEEALLPPGWFCDNGLGPGDRGKCYPAEGYHFEERGGGRVAVHDIATPALRQGDLDTADAWYLLTEADSTRSEW